MPNWIKKNKSTKYVGDSQTFVKALSDWSSKIFWGGSNVIFVPSLFYFLPEKRFFCLFFPKKTFFLPFFPKNHYTGLPLHFGIVQGWSLGSENFRGLGSQENSGCCLKCSTQMASASELQLLTIFGKFSENKKSA